jgi:alkylation response protein AidB-like acyl-CoA dehydrogenase
MRYRLPGLVDFSWSPQQDRLYASARDFAAGPLQAALEKGDAAEPLEAWRLAGEFGLLGANVPEAHGGLGLDPLDTARIFEAAGCGSRDMGFLFAAGAHLFACVTPIVEHGSLALKDAVLSPLVRGDAIGANAITEAEAGSDAFALKSRAIRDGDHYVLSGEKTYVTNGPAAQTFVVYASTEPSHGYMGLSAFAVDRNTPGVRIGSAFAKIGLSTARTSSVYFDDVRIPVEHRLGDEGQGADIFKSSMAWERACLFAAYVGIMDRSIDRCARFATERKQFRKPIARYQAISHKIVDMKLRLESARLLLYRACWSKGQNLDSAMAISLAKIAVSEAAVQNALDAIQIHGGMGVMTEAGIEQDLRDAVPSKIFSGTSEANRNVVATKLGL